MKPVLRSICLAVLVTACFSLATSLGVDARQQAENRPEPNDRVNKSGWTENSIDVDGDKRWYRVLRSKKYQAGNQAVVLLHGGTQSMRKIFERKNDATGHWEKVAEKEGFLLIVPNGTDSKSNPKGNRQNWNDLRTVDGLSADVDDVKFIAELVATLQPQYKFEKKRTYVTGASNGGMMTFRMLIEKPDLFAAGVAFIASLPDDYASIKRPPNSTPLMMVNGTEDPLIKWDGGKVGLGGKRGKTCSVDKTVQWWIETNQCKSKPAKVTTLDNESDDGCRVIRHAYQPKKGGSVFEFVKIEGGGHTLPSTRYSLPDNRVVKRLIGTMCGEIEGAEMAWDFMKAHTK